MLAAGNAAGVSLDAYLDASYKLSKAVAIYGRADATASSDTGLAWDAMGGLRMRF